jgi:serine/threonine-protein kinase
MRRDTVHQDDQTLNLDSKHVRSAVAGREQAGDVTLNLRPEATDEAQGKQEQDAVETLFDRIAAAAGQQAAGRLDFREPSVLAAMDLRGVPGATVTLKPQQDDPTLPIQLDGPDKYVVLKSLGQSARARVYLAYHRDLRRLVTLRVLRMEGDADRRRFLREAQLMAQLEHPGIVPIHDFGVTLGGTAYCTARYLRTGSLEGLLANLRKQPPQPGTPVRLLLLFLQLARAIEYAHSRGVVHRNLTPAAVKLGANDEVQVVDWALARVPGEAAGLPEETNDSDRLLNLIAATAYKAPELARDDPVDERADVFSLGVILYQLLTLTRPFSGNNMIDVLHALMTEQPETPSARAPERLSPGPLDRVCLNALEKDPAQRTPTVAALASAVQSCLGLLAAG